jgi:RNA polymerase sigma-70 factor (ECF subfamily)
MEDQMIIDLFWRRSEDAVAEVQSRYGGMCMSVAGNILKDPEDIRECLNDTYLALWNRIPPERPNILSAYIKRVVRNLALKRSEYNHAAKRSSEATISLDELEGTLCAVETAESTYDAKALAGHINQFLRTLPEEQRKLFVRRYWYFDSIEQLSDRFGMSQSKVKSMLFRLRNKLRDVLLKEGYSV